MRRTTRPLIDVLCFRTSTAGPSNPLSSSMQTSARRFWRPASRTSKATSQGLTTSNSWQTSCRNALPCQGSFKKLRRGRGQLRWSPPSLPDDLLSVLTDSPHFERSPDKASEPAVIRAVGTNFLEREARNRSLGAAGEEFVLKYELARLVREGCESLAHKIEHTSKIRGDHEGYDILSFETNGAERLIEVKTTKYGKETPFFVTRNEVAVSERHSSKYNVYRMFSFRSGPRLYLLSGADRSELPYHCPELFGPAEVRSNERTSFDGQRASSR